MKNEICIREFIFELELDNTDNFVKYCTNVSSIIKEVNLKSTKLGLKRYESKQITKLEIDIGEVNVNDVYGLSDIIVKKIIDKLSGYELMSSSNQTKNTELSVLEYVLFVIDNGFYPWPYDSKSKFNAYLKKNFQFIEDFELLRNKIVYDNNKFKRLYNLLSKEMYTKLFEVILGNQFIFYNSQDLFFQNFNSNNTIDSLSRKFALFSALIKNGANIEATIDEVFSFISKDSSIENTLLKIKQNQSTSSTENSLWYSHVQNFLSELTFKSAKRDAIYDLELSEKKGIDFRVGHLRGLIHLTEGLKDSSYFDSKSVGSFLDQLKGIQSLSAPLFIERFVEHMLSEGSIGDEFDVVEKLMTHTIQQSSLTAYERNGLEVIIDYYLKQSTARSRINDVLTYIRESVLTRGIGLDIFVRVFLKHPSYLNALNDEDYVLLVQGYTRGKLSYKEVSRPLLLLISEDKREKVSQVLRRETLRYIDQRGIGLGKENLEEYLLDVIRKTDKSLLPEESRGKEDLPTFKSAKRDAIYDLELSEKKGIDFRVGHLRGLIHLTEGLKDSSYFDSKSVGSFLDQLKGIQSLSAPLFIERFVEHMLSEGSIGDEFDVVEKLMTHTIQQSSLTAYERNGLEVIIDYYLKQSTARSRINDVLTYIRESVLTRGIGLDIFVRVFLKHPSYLNALNDEDYVLLVQGYTRGKLSYKEVSRPLLLLISEDKREKVSQVLRRETLRYIDQRGIGLGKENLEEYLLDVIRKTDKSLLPEEIRGKKDGINLLRVEIEKDSRQKSIKKLDVQYAEEDYFDYMLNLVNDLRLTNKESHSTSKNFKDLEELFINKGSFISFLWEYRNENSLLFSLAKLSLKSQNTRKFKIFIDSENFNLLNVELKWLDIFLKYRYVNSTLSHLTLFARFQLLKTIGYSKFQKKRYNQGDYSLHLLNYLEYEKGLYYDQLKTILKDEYLFLEKDMIIALSTFLEQDRFEKMSPNETSNLFFQDLNYFYLKFDKAPFWKEKARLTSAEIDLYLKLSFNSKNKQNLKRLFSDREVLKNLIPVLTKKNNNELLDIILKLESYSNVNDLSTFLKFVLKRNEFSERQFKKLFETILNLKLWKTLHWDLVSTQLRQEFKSKQEVLDLLTEFETENYPGIKSFDIEKQIQNWSSQKLIAVIQYYIDYSVLPGEYNEFQNEIIERLNSISFKEIEENITLFKGYFKKLIDGSFSYQLISNELLLRLFFEAIEINSVDENEFTQLINKIFKSKQRNKDYLFSLQFMYDNFIFKNENINLLKTYFFSSVRDNTQSQLPEIEELDKLNHNTIQLNSKLLVDDMQKEFDYLKYFLEVGSSHQDKIQYGLTDYLYIIEKLKRSGSLILKNNLYKWSIRNKSYITNLLRLYKSQTKKNDLLDVIIPGLSAYFNEKKDFIKSILPRHIQRKNDEDFIDIIIAEYFGSWSIEGLNVSSTKKITITLILNLWRPLSKNKRQFSKIIEDLDNKGLSQHQEIINNIKTYIQNLKPQIMNTTSFKSDVSLVKEIEKGVLIQNSGLIITWPFLSTLFSKLNLTEDSVFKNDYSTQKAIIASQYMVYGSIAFDEDSLLLNKILCGVPFEHFVDMNITLTETEKGICDMALEAILSQWKNVKSIQALREYFLQRQGLLQSTNSEYILRVNEETRDILLKFIIWNLSLIKTSHMDKPLTIYWKY